MIIVTVHQKEGCKCNRCNPLDPPLRVDGWASLLPRPVIREEMASAGQSSYPKNFLPKFTIETSSVTNYALRLSVIIFNARLLANNASIPFDHHYIDCGWQLGYGTHLKQES